MLCVSLGVVGCIGEATDGIGEASGGIIGAG
jgi:hypothetical protein